MQAIWVIRKKSKTKTVGSYNPTVSNRNLNATHTRKTFWGLFFQADLISAVPCKNIAILQI